MAYNVILKRPLLNKVKGIISTFYLTMKFPTSNGIGVVRRDQRIVGHYYFTSIYGISTGIIKLSTSEPELKQQGRLAPVEELIEVKLVHGKKVTIGRDLDVTLMAKLISCLSHNIDVIAWNVKDMPRINLEVVVHKHNIFQGAKLVK